jgi:hypothetical protein
MKICHDLIFTNGIFDIEHDSGHKKKDNQKKVDKATFTVQFMIKKVHIEG